MILKGQNLRLKLGGKYIAGATSCQIHASADLEETSTKDSTGSWKEQEVVAKAWDGSADALVVVDASDTDAVQGMDALDLVGQTVEVSFVQTEGTQNRQAKSGGLARYGKAIVNDVSQTYGNKANGTYTIQFQGVGELSKTAPSTSSSSSQSGSSEGQTAL